MKAKYNYTMQILGINGDDDTTNAASFRKIRCRCGREYLVVPDFEKRAKNGNFWLCKSCGFEMTQTYIKEQLKGEKSWIYCSLEEVIDSD